MNLTEKVISIFTDIPYRYIGIAEIACYTGLKNTQVSSVLQRLKRQGKAEFKRNSTSNRDNVICHGWRLIHV